MICSGRLEHPLSKLKTVQFVFAIEYVVTREVLNDRVCLTSVAPWEHCGWGESPRGGLQWTCPPQRVFLWLVQIRGVIFGM